MLYILNIFIYENSGYGNPFNLNPKITYISEYKVSNDIYNKGRSQAYVMWDFIKKLGLKDNDKILYINGRYAPLDLLYDLLYLLERHDAVVSGLPPDYGGINTRWHGTTVKILKEVIGSCGMRCHDTSFNYETNFKYVVEKYNPFYYPFPIPVVPTYEGGTNRYQEYM